MSRLGGAAWLVVVGLWFALVAGLLETSVLLFQRYVLHDFIWLGRDFPWMTPVGYVVLFGPLALGFAALALWRGPLAVLLAVWLFSFLAFISLLFLVPPLHHYASLVLAAGLAVQTTRLVVAREAGFGKMVRVTTPGLAGIVVVTAFGMIGAGWWADAHATNTLPAARAGAPNVLLVILDTVRASRLSLYGYPRPTSRNLERLARRGVVFERAITTSSSSLPAHAAMFTGHVPNQLSIGWEKPLPPEVPLLAEVMRTEGYLTAGFSGNLYYLTEETGLARGFLHFDDYPRTLGQAVRSSSLGQALVRWRTLLTFERPDAPTVPRISGRKGAPEVDSAFLRWVSQVGDRPFFAALNYIDAHRPYDPPAAYRNAFLRGCRVPLSMAGCAARMRADLYDGTIAYLDERVGRLLAELGRRGLLENTVVIVTSDHGELLGEHGLEGHGHSLYLQLLHVPLVIAAPGGPEGIRVGQPVSLRDLPQTILDLVGAQPAHRFPGASLAPRWRENPADLPEPPDTLLAYLPQGINTPPEYPATAGDVYSLVAWPFHYISNGDGSEELYDVEGDPAERRNLVADAGAAAVLRRFRRALTRRKGPR